MSTRWVGVGEPRVVGPRHAKSAQARLSVRDWLMLAALPTVALSAAAGVTQARAVEQAAAEQPDDQPTANGLARATPLNDRDGPRPQLRR